MTHVLVEWEPIDGNYHGFTVVPAKDVKHKGTDPSGDFDSQVMFEGKLYQAKVYCSGTEKSCSENWSKLSATKGKRKRKPSKKKIELMELKESKISKAKKKETPPPSLAHNLGKKSLNLPEPIGQEHTSFLADLQGSSYKGKNHTNVQTAGGFYDHSLGMSSVSPTNVPVYQHQYQPPLPMRPWGSFGSDAVSYNYPSYDVPRRSPRRSPRNHHRTGLTPTYRGDTTPRRKLAQSQEERLRAVEQELKGVQQRLHSLQEATENLKTLVKKKIMKGRRRSDQEQDYTSSPQSKSQPTTSQTIVYAEKQNYKPESYVHEADIVQAMEIKNFLDQMSVTVPMFERLRVCVDMVLVKYILVEFDEFDVSSNFFPRICETLPGHSQAQESATRPSLSSSLIATCTLGISKYLNQFAEETKYCDIRKKISKRTANARTSLANGKFEQFKHSLLKNGQKLKLWQIEEL
ncbi:hypothetical protein ACHWQZ_G002516 [Mnemiopsis leidyi]